MDLEDLTPAGGTLRAPLAPRVSEPIATFTQTRAMHPDEIWSPRGSEIAPPSRPLPQPAEFYSRAESESPAVRDTGTSALPHAEVGAQIRAALRPGVSPG